MLPRGRSRGLSTVMSTILLLTVFIALTSTLFQTLYGYNDALQTLLGLEEERLQESIVIRKLTVYNVSEVEYIQAILVNNTGSIISQIRAIYIDNELLCDPSHTTINPAGTYISPHDSLWILLPAGVPYQPTSTITVSTERGIKDTEYQWVLRHGIEPPTGESPQYNGPLELDFVNFYYTECDENGTYDPLTWKAGWQIPKGTGDIVWNITVKNVDDRNVTLNQFSCFTLWPNDQPSNRRAWYIEPKHEEYTQFIAVNETIHLIYIWSTPKMKGMKPQDIYSTTCRCKVFLTFFGVFHEHDGTTTPYGQTIPYQAVNVVEPG